MPLAAGPLATGPLAAAFLVALLAAGPLAAGLLAAGPLAAGPLALGPLDTELLAAGPLAPGPLAAGPLGAALLVALLAAGPLAAVSSSLRFLTFAQLAAVCCAEAAAVIDRVVGRLIAADGWMAEWLLQEGAISAYNSSMSKSQTAKLQCRSTIFACPFQHMHVTRSKSQQVASMVLNKHQGF